MMGLATQANETRRAGEAWPTGGSAADQGVRPTIAQRRNGESPSDFQRRSETPPSLLVSLRFSPTFATVLHSVMESQLACMFRDMERGV
jgi:hypothetical protein